MATLITGGAGFIGSSLARALAAPGTGDLVLLDNFDPYYSPALKEKNVMVLRDDPRVRIVQGDIRDRDLVRSLLRDHHIDRIAHLAALAGVRNSVENPSLYFEVNAAATLLLLEEARAAGVEQIVLASTSSVYGRTTRVPFVEDDAADRPLAPYPASKRAAEIMAHAFAHLWAMNVTCLRFFNVYGPQGRPDMMPLRIMEALLSGAPVPVYNGGEMGRDWTYIDDVVSGIRAALERPLGYQIINLGFGGPVTLNQFIGVLEELSGRRLQRREENAPPSEPPLTFCDNTRARELLGFSPATPVSEGLRHTWEWFAAARGLHV